MDENNKNLLKIIENKGACALVPTPITHDNKCVCLLQEYCETNSLILNETTAQDFNIVKEGLRVAIEKKLMTQEEVDIFLEKMFEEIL